MFPTESRIALAEQAAETLPGSTLRVEDVAPAYVPEGYVSIPDTDQRIKKLHNGSSVVLTMLPF